MASFLYNLPVERTSSSPMMLRAGWMKLWEDGRYQVWSPGARVFAMNAVGGLGSTTSLAADDGGAVQRETPAGHPAGIHTDKANSNQIQFSPTRQPALGAFFIRFRPGKRQPRRPLRAAFFECGSGSRQDFSPCRERYHLQFRADAFNVFNHPNFGFPDTNIASSTFGVITTQVGQELSRVMQFSLAV